MPTLKNTSLNQFTDLIRNNEVEAARQLLLHNKVSRLSLTAQNLNDDDMQTLDLVVASNPFLNSIDLSHNNISAKGAEHIGRMLKNNKKITSLNLHNNNISDEGVSHIIEKIQSVRRTKILSTTMKDPGYSDLSLDLGRNNISNVGLDYIVKGLSYNKLRCNELNLAGNIITDLVFTQDCKNNTVMKLDLSCNPIKEVSDAFKKIGNLKALSSFNVSNTGLSVADSYKDPDAIGFDVLGLRELFHANNDGIYPERKKDIEVEYIADLLRTTPTLQVLDLSSNKMSDEQIHLLSGAISDNSSMLSLNLSSSRCITPRGLDDIFKSVKNNPTIKKIDVSISPKLFDSVAGGSIVGECYGSLIELIRSNKVEELNLSGQMLNANDIKPLAEALKRNTSLKSLDLSYTELSVDQVTEISSELKDNKTLKSLSLSHNDFSQGGIQAICELLSANSNLSRIELRDTNMVDNDVKDLEAALTRNSNLKVCILSHNEITDTGAVGIANILRNNNSLQRLELDLNPIRNDGVKAIASAIDNNSTIISINMDQRGLQEERQENISKINDITHRNCAPFFVAAELAVDVLERKHLNSQVSQRLEDNFQPIDYSELRLLGSRGLKNMTEDSMIYEYIKESLKNSVVGAKISSANIDQEIISAYNIVKDYSANANPLTLTAVAKNPVLLIIKDDGEVVALPREIGRYVSSLVPKKEYFDNFQDRIKSERKANFDNPGNNLASQTIQQEEPNLNCLTLGDIISLVDSE